MKNVMRTSLAVLCLFFNSQAFSGDYYDARIDNYDPSSGLYYKAVERGKEERGFGSRASSNEIVNLNIFDPATGVSTLLFKDPQQDGIALVLFEAKFKSNSIDFGGSDFLGHVLNNISVKKREPRDRLLVGVRNKQKKELTLFVSDKRGNGLTKLVTIPQAVDWHIDVKNSKLRIVSQAGFGLEIESLDW